MDAQSIAPYLIWFGVMAAFCGVLVYYSQQAETNTVTADFKAFQRSYLLVYMLMIMADWMQGPYVYALYDSYGFDMQAIAILFIAGFGSSAVFGTFVGGLADRYGRRANCLIFVVLYGFSCITKHFNNFWWLLAGRILGGISTSILMSAFEAWMVSEHTQRHAFPEKWMNSTFSLQTFGSGIVAILAGLIASPLAAEFGPVAPFDASLALLMAGGALVLLWWPENYGDQRSDGMGLQTFSKAISLMASSERLTLLAVTQTCFESAMYLFVFMWTPALEAAQDALNQDSQAGAEAGGEAQDPEAVPHGVVFAGFMVCVMAGSRLYGLLSGSMRVEDMLRWTFAVACGALAMSAVLPTRAMLLVAFSAFEVCCGIYFPGQGTLRSQYVPEEVRSTVANLSRLGLNLMVVLVLSNVRALAQESVFMLCAVLLAVAALAQYRLDAICAQHGARAGATDGAGAAAASTKAGGVELQAAAAASKQEDEEEEEDEEEAAMVKSTQ